MKKPIQVLLCLFILLSLCSVFYNVSDNNFSQNNSIEDGLSTSDPAILEWVRFWGGDQYETGRSLITDSNENVIVVGQTSSFGSNYDMCLLKYSPYGEIIWNSTILVGGDHWPNIIALDSLENIYVVGTVSSGTFPDIDQDMFLFKFNSSGDLLWQTNWGGGEPDYGDEILIDSFDNVYIAGETYSYGAGPRNVYVIKYNSTGAKLWESMWGGTGYDDCSKIAFDSNEDIYITGSTDIGTYDCIYLVKYNHSGSIVWERIWDLGFTFDFSEDMLIDSSDNIYITGATTYWSSSDLSVVLIKYNSSGEELWWESWRAIVWGYDDLTGQKLALDSVEDIYITGKCTHDFVAEDRDVFLIKIDSLGNKKWYNIWGGDDLDRVRKIFVDPSDDILLVGSTSSYGDDLYLLKYDKLGTFLGDLYWGGSNYIYSWDMTIDTLGNIYATGEFDNLGPTNDDLYLLKYENADPQIEIISPVQNQLYGNMTFNFNLTIVEPNLDQTWYTLNDSTKYFFTGNTGVINQNAWDMCGNGTISLTFYANDSIGTLGYDEVLIQKDVNLPFIKIISPENDSFYESDPPDYTISYGGNNINSTWYSLNNGPNHYFSGNSGTINNSLWNSCLDGEVVIRFYINDSSGWYTSDQVIIKKDTLAPSINILAPTPNQLCGYETIDYSLEVIEVYLDSYWYTLDGGVTNITLSSYTGTIDQTEWNKHGNGTVTIMFYALDEMGNEGSAQVTVRKEATPPLITIISPNDSDIFSIVAPTFELDIQEPDLNTTWYSLDDGVTTFIFTGLSGNINQTEWDKFGNGTVTLKFYANDSFGSENFTQITVYKDISAPNIVINSPEHLAAFSSTSPTFNISVIDFQLDSMWYTLDNGSTIIPLFSTVGAIDQTEWDKRSDGNVYIRFYANDTLGNTAYSEVIVIMDTIQPVININTPYLHELFGLTRPTYDLTVEELNLDSVWYTLDNGITNVSVSSLSGFIDPTEWSKVGNGTVIIQFYARDLAGSIGTSQVEISKDIFAPLITINSPNDSDVFGLDAPTYTISVVEPHLDVLRYTLDMWSTYFEITSLTGTINQTEWDKFGSGEIILRFFAMDLVGNNISSQVTIYKDITAPIITINSPEQNERFSLVAPNFNISVFDIALDSMWYTIDNGSTIIPLFITVGTIDQTEWDKMGEENIYIKFYANDTLGNTAYSEVIIIKDVFYGIGPIELLTPSSYSHITNNLIAFSWSSLDTGFGAVNFTLQVSNVSDFSHITFQSEDIVETPVITNFSAPLSITVGQYYWRVRPTYESYSGNWSGYFLFTLHVNNYSPNLVLNDFTPTTGTKLTIFRFSVIYSDLDNNAPEFVRILINGNPYFMERVDPLEEDFTDGCMYQYLSLLEPSTAAYNLSFECSDGAFQYFTSTYQGPIVEFDSTPSTNQGEEDINSASILAITTILGITIGITIPFIIITEMKVKKMKFGKKTSKKIKKKEIKS